MQRLLLAHDVGDMQLCDGAGEKIGRVDALVLEWDNGVPLRVKTILVGGPVRQDRIGGLARWLGGALRRLGGTREGGISEIPFSSVRRIGDSIVIDVDERAMPSEHTERWLCDHIVARIPGAEGENK
jgi:sporulation protein YlmC with PRC-barrel domain